MGSRLKIKIVTGPWGDHVSLGIWNEVSLLHDLEFLVLDGPESSNIRTSLPVRIFPIVQDMPGYYRDLETQLSGSDLVVAIEWARLGSFQALRCSKSLGIPCTIVVHEFSQDMPHLHSNIQAVKFDIAQNAEHFICSSQKARRLLLSEGILDARISKMPFYYEETSNAFSQQRRDKFRDYVGVKKHQILIVARCSFETTEAAEAILVGFRRFLTRVSKDATANYRLFLIGEGVELEKLKYLAVDLGIGAQTVFMAQDPSSFWRDVCSAAEVIIWDRFRNSESSETYPFAFTQALSAGTNCIIPVGTILDEVAAGVPIQRVNEFTALDVADALVESVLDVENLESRRNRIALYVNENFKVSAIASMIDRVFRSLTKSSLGPSWREKANELISSNEEFPINSRRFDLMVTLEELLLSRNTEKDLTAELWRIKGDYLASVRDSEGAIGAYEKAVQIDSKCFRAHRGLGYAAWLGHSHDDAMTFFKRALMLEHNDYHSLVGVGLIYRRLRMLEESVFWLGRAVDIGGADSTALNLLLQACLEAPEAAISLSTIEQLRESFGDLSKIVRGLSQVYLAQGMDEKAAPLLELA